MNDEANVLRDVAERLAKVNIPYMITGSMAMNFYSQPRMTRDLDVVIEVMPTQAGKIFDLFKEHYYCDLQTITRALQERGMFNLIHSESVFKVDLIVRKDSSFQDQAFQRRRCVKVGDLDLWVISPEDLVISKLLWAKDSLSEMQMRDVRNLIASKTDLDQAYITRWIQVLDLENIYTKVRR